MMAAKLLRFKTVHSLCVRKVFSREVLADKASCYQVLNPQNFHFKRLLSVSAYRWNEKPVIVSAGDIVTNETVSDAAAALTNPSFAELGLGQGWWPVHLAENWFELIYVSTGSPWWMTIALGTFAIRFITLPAFISSRKMMIRYTNHGGKLMQLRNKMAEAGNSKVYADKYFAHKAYRDYAKANSVQFYRIILSYATMPLVFISCFRAITAMSALPVPSMTTDSFYWISNLIEPDPYRILPALSGVMIGLNIYASLKWNPSAAISARVLKMAPFIAVAPALMMPIVFSGFSGAFGIYLLTNSSFTAAVGIALCSKKISTYLNMPAPIPPTPGKNVTVWSQAFGGAKTRAYKKNETREIRRLLKEEKKARKKELKGDPPRLYEIGSEAKLKQPSNPDFKQDWRPPKINVYDQ